MCVFAVAIRTQSLLCLQLGPYGSLSGELDSLRRDKKVLTLELVRLRQLLEVSWAVQLALCILTSHWLIQHPKP